MFEIGTEVECISVNRFNDRGLVVGEKYKITEIDYFGCFKQKLMVKVEGNDNLHSVSRFRKVENDFDDYDFSDRELGESDAFDLEIEEVDI